MKLPIVILAGGMAKRLYPLTKKTPKSLMLIEGYPFIHWQITHLVKQGFKEILICLGYLGEKIIDFLGDGKNYGVKIVYSKDGSELKGTGGAIKNAISKLPINFFVTYGDTLLPINYKEVETFYFNQKKENLIVIYRNNNEWDKSNIFVKKKKIVSYDKFNYNKSAKHIDYGLCILKREEFALTNMEFFDLSYILSKLIKNNNIAGYEADKRFFEIGTKESLEYNNKIISKIALK